MRVLVAHPGLQHSHQLAAALEEAGCLAAFWSGIPVTDSRSSRPELWAALRQSTHAVPVPARHRLHPVRFPMLRRAATALLRPGTANEVCHRLDGAFDAWTARRVAALRPDLVVCYENAALETFEAARAVGAACVLDAAGIHFAAARAWGEALVGTNPAWVDRRKQREIEAADAILTCSELAAETYRAAGVPSERLYALPLGAELPATSERPGPAGPLCRFVFAGSMRRLKGIDLLLDAFGDFEKDQVPARLTLVGGGVDPDLGRRASELGNVDVLPFMPQARLFETIAQHDCLVLPSRFDSFGMVVAEAMAAGVPALVSDRVGAKCIIEQHPGSGWIVPCDAAHLKAQMLWLVDHRAELARASEAARRAAQDYTWPRYRARAVAALQDIHARHAGASR